MYDQLSTGTLDQADFGTQIETFRHELHVHCYRMMGSLQDADDMVQETFLKAWRRRDTVKDRSALRAWLYTIATHVCLDALKGRQRRAVPTSHAEVSNLEEPIPQPIGEPIWLEPYPDAQIQAATEQNPEEQVVVREQITMAFIVALHRLPPRQRAVLLLRDVLDWPADEVATLLDTTVSAVKSALHRARAVMADHHSGSDSVYDDWTLDSSTQTLLAAYVRAWETEDIPAFVRLLQAEATFSMPPIPSWYRGRDTIRELVSRTVFSGQTQNRWRLLPTRANGQPAFAVYDHTETPGLFRAHGIQLVTVSDHAVSDITTFIDAALFRHFDLPATISMG